MHDFLTIYLCDTAANKYLNTSLIFGTVAFVCYYSGQTFPVVLHQVCTHCNRDFGPLLLTDLLQISQVSGLSLTNPDFQLPPEVFNWVQVWRLAGPLQNLDMLLAEPLLGFLGCVLWVVVVLEDPASTHLQCSDRGRGLFPKISQYTAPVILSLTQCTRPVPCADKHPQSMMLPPPCFTVGMVLYCSLFFLRTRLVELWPKCSILVSSDHKTF